MIHVKGNLHNLLAANKAIISTNQRTIHKGILCLCNEITNPRILGHLNTLKKWKNRSNSDFYSDWDRTQFQDDDRGRSDRVLVWAVAYRRIIRNEHRPFRLSEVAPKYLNLAHKGIVNQQWLLPDIGAMVDYLQSVTAATGYLVFLPPFFGNKRLKAEAIARLEALNQNHVLVTPQGPRVPTHRLELNPATGQYSMQIVAQPSPAPAVPL